MSLEAAAVLDAYGKVIYWHLPDDRSAAYLPDSQELWEVLWSNRAILYGVAHSHQLGAPRPSYEDLTTFAAVERGLGRRLVWWILSGDVLIRCHWTGPDHLSYQSNTVEARPPWVQRLTTESRYHQRKGAEQWQCSTLPTAE